MEAPSQLWKTLDPTYRSLLLLKLYTHIYSQFNLALSNARLLKVVTMLLWNSQKAKIQYTSVLFVTPTPGGTLAKELRKREEELNKNCKERIKIMEKGGLKIKDILGSKNPFPKSKCIKKNMPTMHRKSIC